jgi:uncharacterized membrane protein
LQVGAHRFAFVALFVSAIACNDGGNPDAAEADGAEPILGLTSGASCPPQGSALTYASFGQQFMSAYCLRCHTKQITGSARKAPPDRNFDDLGSIRLSAKQIDQQAGAGPAASHEVMPPDGPSPALEQRQKLAQWLACGARSGGVAAVPQPSAAGGQYSLEWRDHE